MRLIDADALEKFIDYGHLNDPNEKLYSENDIREMVDMMPTIEPNWFEAAIPPEGGEIYINENGCAIMGAKTFWEMKKG